MTEYKYEYFSATQKWLIVNTNIILLPNNDRKQISFGHKWSTKYKYKLCWASQKEGLQDQFWVSQGDAKFVEPSDDWSWLQMQTAPNPYDSPDVALVYEDDMQFWRTK